MFSTKVNSLYTKLTMTEKKIADYLIINGADVGGMTSYDLAERLGIGQATVVRFSKKLGYRMFGEMIDDAKNSVGESTSEIIESDTPSDILEKLEKRTCDIIQSIRQSNDAECFARAAKLIDGARNIVCYGYTTSNLFASYLCELLIEIGKGALCESNAILTKRRVFQLDSERDVVIIVSKSGEKSESVGIAEYAKSRGIPVIAISNAGKSPLVEIADVHIKVLEISDRSVPSASMGTDAGVIYAAEVLAACVFQCNQKVYRRQYGNNIVAAFSERK
ncbi:MurR/RpiR family transcriptional regulator [[Collinsella] massiliensis]|uniref:MurR/RpiR family transcriptional regulator n=1 Tax=[Collinsella] massiliensis TaxID=1232426 RepID=A0A1Y3XSW4_9ACTN|nr:MurR/RpiR family transcriptional regulator [[Collinsella] massiliensis]OUN88622.1 MurR/RpiR family transcriptional regulator [[Collinsella] massiliensis]